MASVVARLDHEFRHQLGPADHTVQLLPAAQIVSQPGSPSPLRPRNPPSLANVRKKSRTFCQRSGSQLPTPFQEVDVTLGHDLLRRPIGFRSRHALQPQQPNGYHRHQPNQGCQAVAGLQLPMLDIAAGFQGFVKLLDRPPRLVVFHDLNRRLSRFHRQRGEEDPVKWLDSLGSATSRTWTTQPSIGWGLRALSEAAGWRGTSMVIRAYVTSKRAVRADWPGRREGATSSSTTTRSGPGPPRPSAPRLGCPGRYGARS